ncbi:hypothetical protein BMR1_02g03915 [Babesia microti strain RI]|uniref:Band 7 domain-containing protein n=1 Tax=Babesia microti (strain RI) TaxID=1133968 RepID=I7J6N0_BABMR|nr:hypothetical protein BMR1_02g03915 [Babesia microti strain RI]CCF73932.1 hypothetical protein BMR1_02g03915 [Babesia microti strain RI]|eukprot:XP_012648541.1 hypothetical protein BMR1_02g03915 [Babesia microti strain RI]
MIFFTNLTNPLNFGTYAFIRFSVNSINYRQSLVFFNKISHKKFSFNNKGIAIKQDLGLFVKPSKPFKILRHRWFIYLKLYTLPFLFVLFLGNCVTIIPPGYVGILDNIDGTIDPYISEGKMVLIHFPYYERGVTFRISPIRRKIINTFTTNDGKQIEAVVFCTLQAKAAYAAEIYILFGSHFSKSFAEREMEFDLARVIEKYKYEDFFDENPDTVAEYSQNILQPDKLVLQKTRLDQIREEIFERFDDAGKFHKIDVSNVTLSFRDPII